ncbi:VOC family protein [Pacificimonas sp. WHA3]|uniref:VOC family protein n=1 Tax=Pacificimonas pallii TaxID=2827236 RepID=A0ABS6SFE3_9SPHN|nr:VOC family protein [Pacificimonas pallii]MBV7257124.1 VOC family protein [Pacificimonas pallii]
MIDHLEVQTRQFGDVFSFYQCVLPHVGYRLEVDGPAKGFANGDRLDFFIVEGAPSTDVHFAFRAPDRNVVDTIFETAGSEGWTQERPPALAPHIHPNYYAAYLRDPDGRLIEFVTHVES